MKKGFDHDRLPRKVILGDMETKTVHMENMLKLLDKFLLTEGELSSIVGVMKFGILASYCLK